MYVRRGHMPSRSHYDNLTTFRGETEQRRQDENGGSSCAVAERRCRHDVVNTTINVSLYNNSMLSCTQKKTCTPISRAYAIKVVYHFTIINHK